MSLLVRRLRSVPPRQWPAFGAAAAVAVAVEVGLRTLKLPVLARIMGVPLKLDGGPSVLPADRADLPLPAWARVRLKVARRVMGRWPFGDTCLRRALVSGQRLRRLRPRLRVGVAKVDDEFRAHAWLEIDGVSLDPAAASFESLEEVTRRPAG